MKKRAILIVSVLLAICLLFSGCGIDGSNPQGTGPSQITNSTSSPDSFENNESSNISTPSDNKDNTNQTQSDSKPVSLDSIPAYSGKAFVNINNGNPGFSSSELKTKSYEYYSPLDRLGRCGVVHACIGRDIMPTEDRGSIGMVKPTGCHTVKYDCVDGKYLYNRCHLIGYQLTGENVNESNLITGTRYLNIDGMVDFENMVADYIRETGNHVLYRVTPIFVGDELLARGVQMEAYSVEDQGDGICFHIYAYNVQPGITIDYATGLSALAGEPLPPAGEGSGTDIPPEEGESDPGEVHDYVLNTNTKKFHYPDCSSAKDMSEANREDFTGTREAVTNRGYEACGRCKP